jgi:PhnB protein
MQLAPTAYFPGRCHEAVAFYAEALDGEVLFVRRLGDCIDAAHVAAGTENKILRAAIRIGPSVLYLSDGHGAGQPGFHGFSLSLTLPSIAEAQRVVDRLSERGKLLMPLRATAWANTLAALIDPFGVHWTVEAAGDGQGAGR